MNKQNIYKKIFLILLVIVSILLTSCQVGSRVYQGPQTTNFFTGTKGLTVEFLNQAPPDEAYEETSFDTQLLIHNQGSFSLSDQSPYAAQIDIIYDESKLELENNYPQPSDELESLVGLNKELTSSTKFLFLEGKTPVWPQGQEEFLTLARFKTKKIIGNFQGTTTPFIAQVCYPYETSFSDEVCIDTDTQGIGKRDEVCKQQDKSYSSGQGAPIGVSSVQSQMIPRGVYVQPQFTIKLKHYGEGSVSYRNFNKKPYDSSSCSAISRDDVNNIYVEVFLAGDKMTCLPKDIRFVKGEATIKCQLTEDKILGVSTNYETTLQVKASYLYSQSFRKDVFIQKSQGTLFEDSQVKNENDCFPWQVLDGNSCVNTCEFLSKNNNDYPGFSSLSKITKQDFVKGFDVEQLWNNVTCLYKDSTTCKANPQLCVLENNLCPSGSFCGLPSCVLKDTAPAFSQVQKVGLDQISFFCTDADDKGNLQQTCGCATQAKYGFVEKKSDCNDENVYTVTSKGKRTNTFGVKHTIDGLNNEAYKDKFLCLEIRDVFNKKAVKVLKYPFLTS